MLVFQENKDHKDQRVYLEKRVKQELVIELYRYILQLLVPILLQDSQEMDIGI